VTEKNEIEVLEVLLRVTMRIDFNQSNSGFLESLMVFVSKVLDDIDLQATMIYLESLKRSFIDLYLLVLTKSIQYSQESSLRKF